MLARGRTQEGSGKRCGLGTAEVVGVENAKINTVL